MLEEVLKVCKIHGTLTSSQVKKEFNGLGYVSLRCNQCKIEKDARYRQAHRKELCDKNKEYKKNNRDIVNSWNRKDRANNPEKHKIWSKNFRDKLGDFRNVIEISRLRGISTDQYQSMIESQNYKCFICKLPERRRDRSGNLASLCLDHNHKTNKIRNFLCHNCNTMIGHFNESIDTMTSAIKYLIKHGAVCQK